MLEIGLAIDAKCSVRCGLTQMNSDQQILDHQSERLDLGTSIDRAAGQNTVMRVPVVTRERVWILLDDRLLLDLVDARTGCDA